MEVRVRLVEATVVELVEETDLRRARRRARGVHVTAAGWQNEQRDERERGDAPHHSESFLIDWSTPLI
jgi:hypothetical protein